MPEQVAFERARTAVLLMDYQNAIVSRLGADQDALLERAARVLAAARRMGIMVIYVHVAFRRGFPEISPRNKMFSSVPREGRFLAPDEVAIHPAVAPAPDDITVVKHRVSAFAGTDLETILRAKEIDTLLLLGISTSGVVLSTVRHAADADYRIFVVRDCCADPDIDLHATLMNQVFPRQATVIAAADFTDSAHP